MPKPTVTARDRAREYEKEGFYAPDNATLFCKFCNIRVVWDRKDTIVKHLQTVKHKAKKLNEPSSSCKRQSTIASSFEAAKKKKSECDYLAQRTVETFLKANIPLQKLENKDFREWMNEFIEGAGNIPCVKTMRENIVPSIKEKRKAEVIEQLSGKDVVVLADETTDRRGRCVFAVLFRTIEAYDEQKLFVASVSVLEAANSTQCARAILGALQAYNIQYDSVKAVVSDSARYMNKCVESLKTIIGDQLIHIQCWAHKINLIANIFSKELKLLNSAISNLKSAFLNTRKRKHLYLQFLREQNKDPKVFPLPVLTRWNSWLSTSIYVAEYFAELVKFFRSEDMREMSNAGIEYINALSDDEVRRVQVEAIFIKEHAKDLMSMSVFLETSKIPTAHELCSKLKQLEICFSSVSQGVFGEETTEIMKSVKKEVLQAEIREGLKRTGLHLQTKLSALMATDPSKALFKALDSCLNPRTVIINPVNSEVVKLLQGVPGMNALSAAEILKGYQSLQNFVQHQFAMQTGHVDIVKCLLATAVDNPQFAATALKAVWYPSSNVDSERLFSQYNEVLTDRRHNLSEENIETMTMLSFERASPE